MAADSELQTWAKGNTPRSLKRREQIRRDPANASK